MGYDMLCIITHRKFIGTYKSTLIAHKIRKILKICIVKKYL